MALQGTPDVDGTRAFVAAQYAEYKATPPEVEAPIKDKHLLKLYRDQVEEQVERCPSRCRPRAKAVTLLEAREMDLSLTPEMAAELKAARERQKLRRKLEKQSKKHKKKHKKGEEEEEAGEEAAATVIPEEEEQRFMIIDVDVWTGRLDAVTGAPDETDGDGLWVNRRELSDAVSSLGWDATLVAEYQSGGTGMIGMCAARNMCVGLMDLFRLRSAPDGMSDPLFEVSNSEVRAGQLELPGSSSVDVNLSKLVSTGDEVLDACVMRHNAWVIRRYMSAYREMLEQIRAYPHVMGDSSAMEEKEMRGFDVKECEMWVKSAMREGLERHTKRTPRYPCAAKVKAFRSKCRAEDVGAEPTADGKYDREQSPFLMDVRRVSTGKPSESGFFKCGAEMARASKYLMPTSPKRAGMNEQPVSYIGMRAAPRPDRPNRKVRGVHDMSMDEQLEMAHRFGEYVRGLKADKRQVAQYKESPLLVKIAWPGVRLFDSMGPPEIMFQGQHSRLTMVYRQVTVAVPFHLLDKYLSTRSEDTVAALALQRKVEEVSCDEEDDEADVRLPALEAPKMEPVAKRAPKETARPTGKKAKMTMEEAAARGATSDDEGTKVDAAAMYEGASTDDDAL